MRWYDHGDYAGLERILESIRKEDKKYKRNPTASRRFIVTEGIFENDGSMVDLPKVVRPLALSLLSPLLVLASRCIRS